MLLARRLPPTQQLHGAHCWMQASTIGEVCRHAAPAVHALVMCAQCAESWRPSLLATLAWPGPHAPAAPPPHAGISPITRDFVNPEAPWPHLRRLAAATAAAGKALLPRLPVYPRYLHAQQLVTRHKRAAAHGEGEQVWLDRAAGRGSPAAATLRLADADGLARGSTWFAGAVEDGGAGEASEVGEARQADTTSGDAPGRAQQHAAPPAAAQQQQQQQQQLKSSIPRIRRRGAERSWHVAMADDGLLQGCPGPDHVSADVQQLLAAVLEQQHELGDEEIEVLLTGKHLLPAACSCWLHRCVRAQQTASMLRTYAQPVRLCPPNLQRAAPTTPRCAQRPMSCGAGCAATPCRLW